MTNATQEEPVSLEELQRQLDEALLRRIEIEDFKDPAMQALNLRWNAERIEKLQGQIKQFEKGRSK